MGSVAENVNKAIAKEEATEVVGPLEMVGGKMLEEIIESLPERVRPLAETYGSALVGMTVTELEAFLMGALTDPVEEYKRLYEILDTVQAIEAGKVLSEYWKELNTENWNAADQQRLAMGELTGVAAMMLLSMV